MNNSIYQAVHDKMAGYIQQTTTESSSDSKKEQYNRFFGTGGQQDPVYSEMACYIGDLLAHNGYNLQAIQHPQATQVIDVIRDFLDNERAKLTLGAYPQHTTEYRNAMKCCSDFSQKYQGCPYSIGPFHNQPVAPMIGTGGMYRGVQAVGSVNTLPGVSQQMVNRNMGQQHPLQHAIQTQQVAPVQAKTVSVPVSPQVQPQAQAQPKPLEFRVTDATPHAIWFDPNKNSSQLIAEEVGGKKIVKMVLRVRDDMDRKRHLERPKIQPVWESHTVPRYVSIDGVERERKPVGFSDIGKIQLTGESVPAKHETIESGVDYARYMMDVLRTDETKPHLLVHEFVVETNMVLPTNVINDMYAAPEPMSMLLTLRSESKRASYRTLEKLLSDLYNRLLKSRLGLSLGIIPPSVKGDKLIWKHPEIVSWIKTQTGSDNIANVVGAGLTEITKVVLKEICDSMKQQKASDQPLMTNLRSVQDAPLHAPCKVSTKVVNLYTTLASPELRADTITDYGAAIKEDDTPLLYALATHAMASVTDTNTRVFITTVDEVHIELSHNPRFQSTIMGRYTHSIQ